MKTKLRIIVAIAFVGLSLSVFAQPYAFIKQLGSIGNDEFNFIKLCNDGGIVASGNTDSNVTLGSNQLNYSGGFVTKFDSAGTNLWIIPAGENIIGFAVRPDETYPGITVDDSNNIYVFGEFSDTAFVGSTIISDTGSNNCFLAKLNANGNVIWLKKVCDEGYLFSAGVDPYGNVVLIGNFSGTVHVDTAAITSAGGSGYDILIVKYDSNGNLVWVKQAGGSGFYDDTGFSIDVDNSGNIYVGGHIRTNANFDSLTLLSHGIAGYDGFIAKYNSAGNIQFVKYCGYTCNAVAVDLYGNCYVGGYIYNDGYFDTTFILNSGSGANMYIARINSSGIFDWIKFNETNDYSGVLGLAADNSGHCYASGLYNEQLTIHGTDSIQLQSSLCGGTEINSFILCLDSTGNPVFGKTLQSCLSGSNGSGIDVRDCRVAATGVLRYQQAPVYFDNDSLISVGATDGYLVIIDTCLITTSILDLASERPALNIFPNPSRDICMLKFNNTRITNFTIQIQNMEGKIIKHFSLTRCPDNFQIPIPLNDLQNGLYIVSVQSDEKLWHTKLVKQ